MKALLVVLLVLPLLAQTTPRNSVPNAGKAVYGLPQAEAGRTPMVAGPAQQVSMALIRLRDAAISGDGEALNNLLADDCVLTLPAGEVLGKKRTVLAFQRLAGHYQALELSDIQVRMLAPTVGVVNTRAELKGQASFRVVVVWQKQAANWRAVVIQTTQIL